MNYKQDIAEDGKSDNEEKQLKQAARPEDMKAAAEFVMAMDDEASEKDTNIKLQCVQDEDTPQHVPWKSSSEMDSVVMNDAAVMSTSKVAKWNERDPNHTDENVMECVLSATQEHGSEEVLESIGADASPTDVSPTTESNVETEHARPRLPTISRILPGAFAVAGPDGENHEIQPDVESDDNPELVEVSAEVVDSEEEDRKRQEQVEIEAQEKLDQKLAE